MKKILLCLMVISGLNLLNAQETEFGISAGYNSLIASVSVNGVSASDSATGFYAGVFADIPVNEKLHIQPEVLISVTSKNGDPGSVLVVPVIGKYYVAEKFNLQAGPQLDYILDDDSDTIKKLGVGLSTGIGYDISDKVFASARYSFGLTNRLDDSDFIVDDSDPLFVGLDIKTKFNFFQIGIGYKF